MTMITIAIDAMSGDHGLATTLPAAATVLAECEEIHLLLVGDEATINSRLAEQGITLDSARYEIVQASQVVDMDEPPAQAMRSKKDSSMRVAINLVKEGRAAACVSAGNTGALMATSRFVLKTLPGIDRPAICTTLPAVSGHTHMLDLGANVDSAAEHLYQFAVMGSVLANAVDGIEAPKVGLLNIGQEDIKGNEQVKEANQLLAKSNLNYIGFVEGDDIYLSDVDVVVCDGFVGNISLKTSEGVAKMVSSLLKTEFKRNWLTKLAAIAAMPVLNAFKSKVDPREYNGASLLGLQGIVIKSHGGADAIAFANAVKVARLEALTAVPQLINKQLEVLLKKES